MAALFRKPKRPSVKASPPCAAGAPFVVGIAGGSASGKSTLCAALSERLQGISVLEFHMDEYFKPNREKPQSKSPLSGKIYTDDNHPDTMDIARLAANVREAQTSGAAQVILVEGLLTLWSDALCDLLHLKIFVDCRADERIVRRLKRNMQWGQSFDEVSEVYLDLVRFRHDEYVEPSKWRADIIVNGAQLTQTTLDMICEYIDTKVKG